MGESIRLESAGAVVVAGHSARLRVAVLHRRSPDEWRLPKGKLRPGEGPREAAEREVKEETGLRVTVGPALGRTEYEYEEQGHRRIAKQVWFYLAWLPNLEALRPERTTFSEALWARPEQALSLLTWENERQMVQRALSLLARLASET